MCFKRLCFYFLRKLVVIQRSHTGYQICYFTPLVLFLFLDQQMNDKWRKRGHFNEILGFNHAFLMNCLLTPFCYFPLRVLSYKYQRISTYLDVIGHRHMQTATRPLHKKKLWVFPFIYWQVETLKMTDVWIKVFISHTFCWKLGDFRKTFFVGVTSTRAFKFVPGSFANRYNSSQAHSNSQSSGSINSLGVVCRIF